MKRIPLLALAATAFAASFSAPTMVQAADHFDTIPSFPLDKPKTERAHDIVDLFAFPKPADSGKLVLIMNVYAGAQVDKSSGKTMTQFSDAIYYSFRLRTGAKTNEGSEFRVTCKFGVAAAGTAQKGSCGAYGINNGQATLLTNATTDVTVDDTSGGKGSPALRAFAGARADAFFGDAVALAGFSAAVAATHGKLAPAPFKALQLAHGNVSEDVWNPTHRTNDLSIVVELDTKKLFGTSETVFRAAAETATKKGK